jgi:hypothetical protein
MSKADERAAKESNAEEIQFVQSEFLHHNQSID